MFQKVFSSNFSKNGILLLKLDYNFVGKICEKIYESTTPLAHRNSTKKGRTAKNEGKKVTGSKTIVCVLWRIL